MSRVDPLDCWLMGSDWETEKPRRVEVQACPIPPIVREHRGGDVFYVASAFEATRFGVHQACGLRATGYTAADALQALGHELHRIGLALQRWS